MITPDLLAAYHATRYVVTDGGDRVTILIAQASHEVDRLLRHHGVDRGAVVTAWNPYSRSTDCALNRSQGQALERESRDRGWAFLPTCAEAQDPCWNEDGILLLGIDEATAQELGRAYKQNAIVYVEIGTAARLLVLTTV